MKSDGRTLILQLARSKSEKIKEIKIWVEKDGFRPDSRLDLKVVETFHGDYKLHCDQLLDNHHTQY